MLLAWANPVVAFVVATRAWYAGERARLLRLAAEREAARSCARGFRPSAADGRLRGYPPPALGYSRRIVIRVLVVEDDALLRSAIASGLPDASITVVAAVPSARAAVALDEPIDVLLTDLDLGDGPNGVVLAHALRRKQPGIGVLVLTSYEDPRLVGTKIGQLPAGAAYVTKQSVGDLAILREQIRHAADRGAREDRRRGSKAPRFTDTQVETMRLVAEGLTNADIARRRFVTEKSVEVTITRILRALGPGDQDLNPRVRITRAYFTLAGTSPPTGPLRP